MAETDTVCSQPCASEKSVKTRLLNPLGIAALAGFVIGGGFRSRLGISLLGLLGRAALRNAAIGALSGAIYNKRNGKDRE
jgi:uncharacterized membrane protein YebE (DUF533 family)